MNKTSRDAKRLDLWGERILKSIAFFFGALVGAVLGGMFFARFVSLAVGDVEHLHWYCALAGGVIGGMSSYSKAAKQLRRHEKLGEVAQDLGLKYGSGRDEDSSDIKAHLREMFAATGRVSIGSMLRKELGDASLVVADVSQTKRSSHGSSSSSHTTTTTVAYFESPHLTWPTFTMQPEGRVLGLLAGIVGLQDIDFDDYPIFSGKYHLSGHHPDAVRALFTSELPQHFSEQHGVQVQAQQNRLLLLRPGEQCEPDQMEAFIQQALQVFGLLMDAVITNEDAIAAAVPQAADIRSQVGQMPGLMGAVLRARLVTPEELDSFLHQPTPRRVPPNVRRQRMGTGSLMLCFVGSMFAVVGSVFAVASIFFGDGPWNEDRIVPLVFGIVFPLIGLPLSLLSLRYRYINGRLLRHGIVTDGVVEGVEKTSVTVNEQQQYRITLRFEAGVTDQQSTMNVYGWQKGQQATKLAERNASVRLLYDPRKPTRALWVESMLPPTAL